ncbi:MAG: hypothetical protein ABSC25_27955 [Roseiarcus sp.]|jgi:hypothetical protein
MIAQVQADDTMRQETISVVHGFGAPASFATDDDERSLGSISRLLGLDERDPITGIPRMSAVPVAIRRGGRLVKFVDPKVHRPRCAWGPKAIEATVQGCANIAERIRRRHVATR